jgi:hypothetical protein
VGVDLVLGTRASATTGRAMPVIGFLSSRSPDELQPLPHEAPNPVSKKTLRVHHRRTHRSRFCSVARCAASQLEGPKPGPVSASKKRLFVMAVTS